MNNIQKATAILDEAESALRKLTQSALDQKRYAEVARLAEMADQLSAMIDGKDLGQSNGVAHAHRRKAGSTSHKRQSSTNPSGFPKFERDGDCLVKIGWSRKKRKSYEHKANIKVVEQLLTTIRQVKGEDVAFTAPDVLPIYLEDNGEKVPNYKTYLALAWLRYEGIVVKQGRDSYVLKSGAPESHEIKDLFNRVTDYQQSSLTTG